MEQEKVFKERIKENEQILDVFELITTTREEVREVVDYNVVLNEYKALDEDRKAKTDKYNELVDEADEAIEARDEYEKVVDEIDAKVEAAKSFIKVDDIEEDSDEEDNEDEE